MMATALEDHRKESDSINTCVSFNCFVAYVFARAFWGVLDRTTHNKDGWAGFDTTWKRLYV